MRRYETILIVDPDLGEEARGPVFDRIRELIPQKGGLLVEFDEWGSRKLAYEIKKKPRGFYVRIDFCGGGDVGALVAEITAACWRDEKNIAEDDVIKACLEAAGFDPSLADSGLLSGAEAYEQNLEDAVNAGVFGAPFFVADDGARFWGQDRIDALDRHLAART